MLCGGRRVDQYACKFILRVYLRFAAYYGDCGPVWAHLGLYGGERNLSSVHECLRELVRESKVAIARPVVVK